MDLTLYNKLCSTAVKELDTEPQREEGASRHILYRTYQQKSRLMSRLVRPVNRTKNMEGRDAGGCAHEICEIS